MTGNRFEQVDEPPGDAMTLVLTRDGDRNFGVVNCPASATGGQLPKNFSSGELPPKEAFRAAIRLKPFYVDAHTGLGDALVARGQPAEAEAAYRAANRLKPDDVFPHYNLGLAL